MRANPRRWLKRLLVVALGFLALCGLFYCGTYGYYGLGHFWQKVVLDSDRPIAKAFYCNLSGPLSDEERRRLESNPDPARLFELEPATLEGGQFDAFIRWTDRPGLFDGPYYQDKLAVVVEFEDGSRACRIVDVPKGMGKNSITVRFR